MKSAQQRKESKKGNQPVFIVGLPRSGTAMIRALLNQHPELYVDPFGARFLSKWMLKWNSFGDLSVRANFSKFYETLIINSSFRRKDATRGKDIISECQWYEMCEEYTLEGVFDALMRYELNLFDRTENIIWVNKTPPMIKNLGLTYTYFKSALFINIIRDPRDVALSQHWFVMKKFNEHNSKKLNDMWDYIARVLGRKNMVLSAQEWKDDIFKARQESRAFPDKYIEVRYEDLLLSPKDTLKKICSFIGVPYHNDMIKIEKLLQPGSDAKVKNKINRGNHSKYKKFISPLVVEEMESVAKDLLVDLGYECLTNKKEKDISSLKKKLYTIHDRLTIIRAAVTQLGLIGGTKFCFQLFFWKAKKRSTPWLRTKVY